MCSTDSDEDKKVKILIYNAVFESNSFHCNYRDYN